MSTAGEHMNMNLVRCFFENDQQPMKDASRRFLILSGQVVSALFSAFRSGKQPGSAGHSFDEFVLVSVCTVNGSDLACPAIRAAVANRALFRLDRRRTRGRRTIEMKCSEVKSDLPLYSDDILTSAERAELDSHLDTCPLCRQSLSEYQSIRNGLRSLARPSLSKASLANLRSIVAAELTPSFVGPTFRLVDERRNWLETWMFPSAIGTFASLLFGVLMLWAILSTAPDPSSFIADSSRNAPASIRIASDNPLVPDALDLTASEYASTRLAIAGESPSVNPQGALVALTRSLVRGEMNDEEVVVVADVFGNGLARIAEVVEPPADDRAIKQLEKALESDPVYAPFVPASFDGRSENMRVILKIQNVNVKTFLDVPPANTPRSGRS